MNSNPLPNYASGGGGVHTLEIGSEGKVILTVTMKRLHRVLRQVVYLKTQAIGDANEYTSITSTLGMI